jgi:hypothetical protein
MQSFLRCVALFLVALTAEITPAQTVRAAPPPRGTPERWESLRTRATCGLRDIIGGMGKDTCGFRGAGFARPDAVRFG